MISGPATGGDGLVAAMVFSSSPGYGGSCSSGRGQADLDGLVTKQKCDLLHQPPAEQPQPCDEREPSDPYSQQQGDTLLGHIPTSPSMATLIAKATRS
jgi:hypothetical protein